jgi:hypothetical protein
VRFAYYFADFAVLLEFNVRYLSIKVMINVVVCRRNALIMLFNDLYCVDKQDRMKGVKLYCL